MKLKISDNSTARQKVFALYPILTNTGPMEPGTWVWLEYVYMWYNLTDRRVEIQTAEDYKIARETPRRKDDLAPSKNDKRKGC